MNVEEDPRGLLVLQRVRRTRRPQKAGITQGRRDHSQVNGSRSPASTATSRPARIKGKAGTTVELTRA